MAEPWAQSYKNLPSTNRAILRGLAVLELRSISGTDLPAVCGGDHRVVGADLNDLVKDGWLVATGTDEWQVPAGPGRWLSHLGQRIDPSHALDHINRFAEHVLELLAVQDEQPVPVDRHHGDAIVATVRAAGRHRQVALAATLADTTWQKLAPTVVQRWWHALADAGETVAIEAREPSWLVDLLHGSGVAFARAGDTFIADRQWRRAFVLTDQIGDRERSAVFLEMIGVLRRTSGSFGRALTVFHELVRLREDLEDQLGLAGALTELATTMMQADRMVEARHYLDRANEALPVGDDLPPQARKRHAKTLMKIGRGWDQQAAPAVAMSCYSRALAELIDLDDETAARARASLAAAAAARSVTEPLPAEEVQQSAEKLDEGDSGLQRPDGLLL
ncbi:MAG: hypothetical protein WBA97_28300 [Actinophytocola sp.]|uniref:tetratricopeptide repeat protein n=1 Tax=Actinophytocola sp. TaxID=1872138 RepID=UPI003C7083B1